MLAPRLSMLGDAAGAGLGWALCCGNEACKEILNTELREKSLILEECSELRMRS